MQNYVKHLLKTGVLSGSKWGDHNSYGAEGADGGGTGDDGASAHV